MKRLFGTDGIRGRLCDGLDPFLAFKVGYASADVLSEGANGGRVLIACDTRLSSSSLTYALASGVCMAGCDAYVCGVLPTPALAYLVEAENFLYGVMVSASHNGAEYNGIKLISSDGTKLADDVEEIIEEKIFAFDAEKSECKKDFAVGSVREHMSAAEKYIRHLKKCYDDECRGHSDLAKLKIGIDCANGAVSHIAAGIFTDLGHDVVFINREPDGKNINLGCGSTDTAALSALVVERGLDLGVAFDGDGDRCLAVDSCGRLVDGDEIIAVMLEDAVRTEKLTNACAVGTVMSNRGLAERCEELGVRFIAAAVGDRYVKEEMDKSGAFIGGEPSGHIVFGNICSTGDGPLTALMLIALISRRRTPLAELCLAFHRVPSFERNIEIDPSRRDEFKADREMDVLREKAYEELGAGASLVLRASGTEPCIRIRIECRDVCKAENVMEWLCERISDKYGI
ncbi:MAG: phosphoglucosamine mutase [Clostridia bacterium]|nr:phosphoglucosamine mutase [Clostridia bacterium]